MHSTVEIHKIQTVEDWQLLFAIHKNVSSSVK